MPPLLALPGPSSSHRVWGDITVDPSRYGHTRVRIRVLPPAITEHERRIWQALHVWPTAGLLLGVACAVPLAVFLPAPLVVAVGVLIWLGPLVTLWWIAQPTIQAIVDRWFVLRADDTPDPACEQALLLIGALDRTWRSPTDDLSVDAWRHAYRSLAAGTALASGQPKPERS